MLAPKWGPHADQAKKKRGVTELQIANAWLHGCAEQTKDGYWRLIGEEVTLILEETGEFIVTMYPNRHNDRHTGKIARYHRNNGNIRQPIRSRQCQN